MVNDTSTYKGLNTQMFSGLRHRSQSVELQLGHAALKYLYCACVLILRIVEMHVALRSKLQS